jgi:hypothetical protein
VAASGSAATRLVELSRFTSQLCPFSSLVDEASASPARNSHSESGRLLLGSGVREPVFLPLVDFRSGCCSAPKLRRSVSLKTCVVLLLRLWCRVRELAREPVREWDKMGGVVGTDELERYEVACTWLPEK